jgi:hypothetical protein
VSLFRLRLDGRRLVVAADRIVPVATLRPMTCTNGANARIPYGTTASVLVNGCQRCTNSARNA